MLLFRLFAPLIWFWVARNTVAGRPVGMRRPWLILCGAIAAAVLHAVLRGVIPYDYSYGGLVLYHALVDWMPVLLLPAVLLALLRWRQPDSDLSLATALSLQWGVLVAVTWLSAYLHQGVWEPVHLFVYPLLGVVLSVLPPLLFSTGYRRWKLRHAVWPLLIAAAAAGAGIQMLFLVRRWAWGSSALTLLAAAIVAAVVALPAGHEADAETA
ncbi:hypothetical protein [Spirochaeta africana]|nr:hypothetical protein [Spirochaeta africana]